MFDGEPKGLYKLLWREFRELGGMMTLPLEGRLALVTGSAWGIGRATALGLADAGADVVINYRTSEKAALEVVDAIRRKGRQSIAVQANVAEPAQVDLLFERAQQELGTIDVLVNNVGAFLLKPLAETTFAEWTSIITSNLHTTFLCSKAALPGMRAQKWGRIINISFAPADKIASAKRVCPYQIAKTGVLILTKTLAAEEVKNGITVNSAGPGFVDTGRITEEFRQQMLKLSPLGRLITPEEVARAVFFLASPESVGITGTHVTVAGGGQV